MNQNELWFRERTLAWKEWRSRRAVIIAALAVAIAAPYLLVGAKLFTGLEAKSFVDDAFASIVGGCCFVAALFGALLLSREEADPARAFIYTLPIPRRQILWTKLKTLLAQWLIIVAAASFVLTIWTLDRENLLAYGTVLFAGIPILLFAGSLSLHFNSPIVGTVAATIAAPVLWATLLAAANGIPDQENLSRGAFIFTAILASALLFVWLLFVYCRSRLLEQGAGARAALGVLFLIAALEVLITIFLTDWSDAAFLLFGAIGR